MSTYRFEVDNADVYDRPKQTVFDLEALDQEAAEYEAEYVLNMFPNRHFDQAGRLYRDGVLVKEMSWTAVPW